MIPQIPDLLAYIRGQISIKTLFLVPKTVLFEDPLVHDFFKVQCDLDLVTLNLVTTCDLMTILLRPIYNYRISFYHFGKLIMCTRQKPLTFQIAMVL